MNNKDNSLTDHGNFSLAQPPAQEHCDRRWREKWFGVMAPKGTPRPIIDRLNATINKFLQEPEMKKNLEAQGMAPSGGTSEKFDKRIRDDYERWVKIVRERNIKPE